MEGETGEPAQDSTRAPVALVGMTGDPTALHRDQGELTRDKERIDDQKERDECQTGGRTN